MWLPFLLFRTAFPWDRSVWYKVSWTGLETVNGVILNSNYGKSVIHHLSALCAPSLIWEYHLDLLMGIYDTLAKERKGFKRKTYSHLWVSSRKQIDIDEC